MDASAHNHISGYKKAVIALIIANIIWGAASPIFKFSLANIPPFSLALFRFYYATLILGLIILVIQIFNPKKTSLRQQIKEIIKFDGKNLILLSLCGITFNIAFFFLGLMISPAINAPVIASAGPVFSFIFAMFFLGEKFNSKKFLGMLIALFGVAFIVAEPLIKNGGFSKSSLGDLFFILATLSACGQSIFGKKIYSNHNFLLVTLLTFVIGTITFVPLALFEFSQQPTWIYNLDIRGMTGIVYGSIFSSAIAYSLLGYGLSKIPASETTIYSYIDPVNAVLVAIPLLGEKITYAYIIGTVFILTGIFIAEKRLQYHPIHKLLKAIDPKLERTYDSISTS